MEQCEEIINAISSLGKNDWFDWLQLIVNIIFSIITFWVAYLTYRLQKQTKADEDKERRLNDVQHVSNVYYFLNDIINKMADIEFEYTSFDNIVVEGKQYMDNINYLRNRYITNEDFGLLRELYALYDGIRTNPKQNSKNFKILYKKVIDTNIEPINIPIYRNNNNYDYIVSLQLLSLLKKLENVLNNYIEVSDNRLTVELDNKSMIIKKQYNKDYYLENNNGVISGNVERYEAVMHFNQDKIYLVYELVYNGSIKNNNPDGKGKYHYYSSENGFNGKIDSCNLNIKGLNYDEIAQEIKNEMSSKSKDGYFECILTGTFSEGKIKSGIIKYRLSSNSEECETRIG